MRSSILTATLIGLVIGSAPVAAQQPTVGEVKAYDRTARTFTLNGVAYTIPQSSPAVGLSNGQKVTVAWQPAEGSRLVRHLWIDEISHDK